MADEELDFTADLEAALGGGALAEGEQQPAPRTDGDPAFPSSETLAKQREYVRDGRRFVPKEGDEAREPKAAKEPAAGKDGEQPVVEAAKAPWRPLWYKDEYGPWDKLSEPFRQALREQERNASQAIEKHSTAAKAWEPLSEQLKPYAAQLQAQGQSPQQFVSGLVNIYDYLQKDPVAALNWLAQQRLGTDIIGIAEWQQQQGYQPQQPDPLKQELEQLKARLSNYEKQGATQERARLEAQIQAWAKDKPHFEDVRELMASLANAPLNRGASLDQLYEAALLAHPQLRQRILMDKQRDEAAKARAAAAVSPRGAQPNGQAYRRGKPAMSLEEEIGKLYDGGV